MGREWGEGFKGTFWRGIMAVEWKKTKYKGVRYYNHPSRKHGIKMDRYFTIRYQRNGKRKEEGVGWTSEGHTAEEAFIKLSELKRADTVREPI